MDPIPHKPNTESCRQLAAHLQARAQRLLDAAERLDAWAQDPSTRRHAQTRNAHKVAVLDGDMKFQAFASENDKARLNETMQAIATQICGVFRVPTFKAGDLSKATYSNMAAGELAYVRSTLDPFFQCWEDAIRRDRLTSRQYNRYSATFDRTR